MSERDTRSPWRRPTRRAFVAMLGAAAAALAAAPPGLRPSRAIDEDRPPSTWSGTTRWIGHC